MSKNKEIGNKSMVSPFLCAFDHFRGVTDFGVEDFLCSFTL